MMIAIVGIILLIAIFLLPLRSNGFDQAYFYPPKSSETKKYPTCDEDGGKQCPIDWNSSPKGYYFANKALAKCPGGTYGDIVGLTDPSCSGPCAKGWYCPEGSTSSKQKVCGGEHVFCPKGSASPIPVRPGFYTSKIEEPCRPGTWRNLSAAIDYSLDEIGTKLSSVPTEQVVAPCVKCKDGTFKFQSGDSQHLCLKCGFQARSSEDRSICDCYQSPTEKVTKIMYFNVTTKTCSDIKSIFPLVSQSEYEFGTQLTKDKEFPCEKGYWCENGIRRPCPEGYYGNKENETNPLCSGKCHVGHWCGLASTSPKQNLCGDYDVYCEEGSTLPTYVSKGYYTDENDPREKKSSQFICPRGFWCEDGIRHPCPAGTYGSSEGLFNSKCNDICSPGFYCPEASVAKNQSMCGDISFHCPAGSKMPQRTEPGMYSSSSSLVIRHDNELERNQTMTDQYVCEAGHYCENGVKYQCPEGTFGWYTGMKSVAECEPCRAGE